MAVKLYISITEKSTNIANNTSSVTVQVNAQWSGGSFNQLQKPGWVKIDGTTYEFTSSFNENRSTSGYKTLYTKTLNIPHNSDGTKTVSVSASYTTGVSSGTITAAATKALTKIARKSTLTVKGTTAELKAVQTLTVTMQNSDFTHTITAKCGTASTTICAKSSSTSMLFTPPIAWASQNTTGTSVSVTYTITTYNDSTSLGSNTYTKTYSMPSEVAPSCSVSVSDPTGYSSTYGGYIKGLSKFKVTVTPNLSHGSPIASYSTTVNGATYTTQSFTTDVLKTSGTLTINATVKDKRGRSGTNTPVNITVLNYAAPKISAMSVYRSDSSGTASSTGAYLCVKFSAAVTSLNSKNTATYVVKYKKSSDTSYTSVTLSSFANKYSVSNGTYVFAASTDASYNVTLSVADKFYNGNSATTKAAVGPSISKLWSILKGGKGMAIGKVAELAGYLDIAFNTRIRGDVFLDHTEGLYTYSSDGRQMELARIFSNDNIVFGAGSRTHSLGGTYVYGNNVSLVSNDVVNISGTRMDVSAPLRLTTTTDASGTGNNNPALSIGSVTGAHLELDGNEIMAKASGTTTGTLYINSDGGNIKLNDNKAGSTFVRGCRIAENWVLWSSGGSYMSASQTATLSEAISAQANGIVLVWSHYTDGASDNSQFHTIFVPKQFVSLQSGKGLSMRLSTATGNTFAFKYLYISDTKITGYEKNNISAYTTNSGIKTTPTAFVLRYVIGV